MRIGVDLGGTKIEVIALDGEELFEFFLDEAILRERLESRQ